MGNNCAPLLADLFLYSYEVEFIQKLLHEKKKSLAVAFNSTFRCKVNTIPILMHQMRTSTNEVSSVAPEPKKLKVEEKLRKM